MSRTHKDSRKYSSGRERRISVRAVRRNPPDLHKLSRAIVAMSLAEAQAEAEAQADAEARTTKHTPAAEPDEPRGAT